MPKATVEGGPSNAAVPEIWVCSACGARYTAGAPRCPECPETAHEEPAADSAEVPAQADGQVPPEPEGAPVTEAPEPSPEPGPAAAAPPRTPPRRTPPADST